MPRGAAPGERRGGRQKGTPNKISASVKEALLEALHAGDGAVAFFTSLKENDAKTFAHLCGKMLPRELTGAGGKELIPQKPDSYWDTWEGQLELGRRVAWTLTKADRALKELEKGKSSTEVSS